MAVTTNAFEMAQRQFDHVAGLLKLDSSVCEMLRWPAREYHFRIPVRMDDGSHARLQWLSRAAQRCPWSQ